MEINGMAHVVLTVSNFETVVPFYEKLLAFLGMKRVFKGEEFLYYVGGRTAVAISKCDDRYHQEQFVQRRVGLHHLCFRARERSDVDSFYGFLQELGAKIVHPPRGRHVGSGLLFSAVRGSRRHPSGDESRSRTRSAC